MSTTIDEGTVPCNGIGFLWKRRAGSRSVFPFPVSETLLTLSVHLPVIMLRQATSRFGGCLFRQRSLQRPSASLTHLFSTNARSDEESPEKPSAPATETPPPEDGAPDALDPALAEKDAEIELLKDRVLRALAEMENVRTIARRDVENARAFGISTFAKGLLDVSDNLGFALAAVPEASRAEGEVKGLFEGVQGTERELAKVLKKNGVEKFGAKGDAFDPMKYQALFEVPTKDEEPGVVVEVAKTGYLIGERLLRPAEVGVSKAI